MKTGVEEERQTLKLTTEEERAMVAGDEEDVQKNEHIALCLLVRLYMESVFPFEGHEIGFLEH